MYRISNSQEKRQIQEIVYTQTPIDQIISTQQQPTFLEVTGRAGKDILTYRIYDNGNVTEK